ncbi:TIGR03862 family flavoprotein [uncultured Xylophilus sp.]|uniref:TIGR03862 family flavoprotein n=1 Tax=uncultured Xylophilus sp. TaxID=296832 RepID=UPI0025DDB159|nr:TIGR03862 family flavoprotein [uncultured Xylophilus sp.]
MSSDFVASVPPPSVLPTASHAAASTGVSAVAIVGAGPAGLMAAEVLSAAGHAVHVYDAMASVGRKFLLAGRGGLNLTHAEPVERFVGRYGARRDAVAPWLQRFGAAEVRAWAEGLGIATFVGSSDRVFPTDMKAAPLLRAWLHRLRAAGVQFHMWHRWLGWTGDGALRFATPAGEAAVRPAATVLALGGGSWPRLGSDGAWVPLLEARGVPVLPLVPANCGFDVAARAGGGGDADAPESRREFLQSLVGRGPAEAPGWTPHFAERFAGQPFKSVALHFEAQDGRCFDRKGEFVATATGVEGSLVYAASALLRDEIAARGSATFQLDLLPDRSPEQVLAAVRHPRGARSLSGHLKSRLGIDGIKAGILYERLGKEAMADPAVLAAAIKALPITVTAPRPLAEAISSAGGVPFEALDARGMLAALPGVFCAGEMLDWEAPTGGYLLTACMASGVAAAQGVADYLAPAA